uniref:Uncharacterized protein n=1 Tax=Plectus sambesii TaxID=2011161 RepID=A0A914WV18_9BILA
MRRVRTAKLQRGRELKGAPIRPAHHRVRLVSAVARLARIAAFISRTTRHFFVRAPNNNACRIVPCTPPARISSQLERDEGVIWAPSHMESTALDDHRDGEAMNRISEYARVASTDYSLSANLDHATLIIACGGGK